MPKVEGRVELLSMSMRATSSWNHSEVSVEDMASVESTDCNVRHGRLFGAHGETQARGTTSPRQDYNRVTRHDYNRCRSCDRSRWRAKPNAVTKCAITLQLCTTRRHFSDDVWEIALVNRDLRTFARFISFQQKRGDKHNHRAHCQQPVHIDVRENCSLGLNHGIQSAQGLLLSGVRV